MGDALISIIPDMKRRTVDAFVKKANEYDSPLLEKEIKPVSLAEIARGPKGNGIVSKTEDISSLDQKLLRKGDSVCLDFGDHHVGYVSVKLDSGGIYTH